MEMERRLNSLLSESYRTFKMIGILVDVCSNRMRYTFDFIFKSRGIDYVLASNPLEFKNLEPSFRLNYSSYAVEDVKQIKPALLLRESSVLSVKVEKGSFMNNDCLSFDDSADIIASIFYVLTRYEEYGSKDLDVHGRYESKNSIQHKFGWLGQAICDRWAKAVIEYIHAELYIDVTLASTLGNPVKTIPTFDIDNAYAYKFKSGSRRKLSRLKDLLKFDQKRLRERSEVEGGGEDPYDTYDKITGIAKDFEVKIFWLVRSDGKFDRNLSLEIPEHKALIKRMAENASIGLHPSYLSHHNSTMISEEHKMLESAVGSEVKSARFHFLRFDLPTSYRELAALQFTDDFSMGYAEATGFRAGTARNHLWFDLESDEVSELMIHPFVYMDGTLNEYLHLSLEESKKRILSLYQEVKEYGGNFSFIWHNETIGGYGKWNGWEQVLEYTLQLNE